MTRAALAAVLIAVLPGCFHARGGDEGGDHCPKGRVVDLGLQEDVTSFAGCKKASGILIRTGATVDVTPLSDLEEISGDLVVGPTVGVDTIVFNGLIRVGGTIRIANNGSLRGVFLPRLEEAGRLEVDNNAVLSTISVPRLATVTGAMVITDNNALELLTATTLTTIGQELVIAGQPKLQLLEMQRIAHISTIRLEANPKLPPEVVEQLRSAAAMP